MIARIEAQDAPYRCSRCGFVIPPDTSIVVMVWNELQFHYCPACVEKASEVKTS
jgi:predicted RNA-binding Zn-ribbon protein involved in translation (DUF1610 family)